MLQNLITKNPASTCLGMKARSLEPVSMIRFLSVMDWKPRVQISRTTKQDCLRTSSHRKIILSSSWQHLMRFLSVCSLPIAENINSLGTNLGPGAVFHKPRTRKRIVSACSQNIKTHILCEECRGFPDCQRLQ